MTNTEPYPIQEELGGAYRKTDIERNRGGRECFGGCPLPGFGAGGGNDTQGAASTFAKHSPHGGCVTEACTSVWHLACPEAKLKFIVPCSATNDLQSTASAKATDDPSDKAGSESGKKPSVHSLETKQTRAERNLTGREAVPYKEKSAKSRFNFHTLYPPSPWIKVNNSASLLRFLFSE